tara:strand:+ start:2006 stop:2440 length:435 start_codon:yes stop_codon:yes gene_type:complete
MLTVEMIREHIQDYPEKNRLLCEYEFSDDEICIAIRGATSQYNTYPPHHIRLQESFPDNFNELMMQGTLAKMFRGKAFQQFRNQLNFQDGGASGGLNDKGQPYSQLAENLQAKFRANCLTLKKSINYGDGFGEIGSDYISLPFY